MEFETLQKDMIAAMKDRDKVRKEAISSECHLLLPEL